MSDISNNILNEINTSCVLSFLAENINLYNWHLVREENINCAMYDETGIAMNKTRNILFHRAEENTEVSIQLRNTISKLKLISQPEDILMNATLLINYIHDRQYYLYTYKVYSENELELWDEVKNTNPPSLYVKLKKLEDIYMKILSHEHLENMCYTAYGEPPNRVCYNAYYEPTDGVFDPPSFGWMLEYLELEKIYITDNLPSDFVMLLMSDSQEDNNNSLMEHAVMIGFNTLKVINTPETVFDCPICYEEQTFGNGSITTTCGHHYCEPCFMGMTQHKLLCAMCRGEIIEYYKYGRRDV
jgi:hypothetical protein